MGSGLPDGPLRGLLDRLAHVLAPPPERPAGLPIERIARNARRLHAELATIDAGTPQARRLGMSEAYDDLLCDACRALGVPDTFSHLAPGPDRDCERLRVEHELEKVGLRLSA